MCSEKQSLQRVFARSHSAKDCRLVVQQVRACCLAARELAAFLHFRASHPTNPPTLLPSFFPDASQYNEARGTIEAEDAEQALEAAAGGDGGWDEDGREAGAWGEQDGPAAAPGVQQQAQQQRWRAFQDQEAEVGAAGMW